MAADDLPSSEAFLSYFKGGIGEEELLAPLRGEAEEVCQKGTPFVEAGEFLRGSTEVNWLVPELIPCGSLCLIAGRPKVGKSLLSLNLAVALVTGGRFLGREVPRVQTAIVQLEDPAVLVRKRLGAMVEGPPEGLFLSVGQPWGEGLRARLPTLILAHELDLVIIDPLVLWRPGTRENSAEEMAGLLYDLRRVVQLTGCTAIVVHHSRKGDGEHGDSIRGSSAILGAVDVALELVKEEEGRAHLRVISRFGAVEGESLELDTVSLTWHSLGPAQEVERNRRRERVLQLLAEREEGLTAVEILERMEGVSRATLYRDLDNLESEGLVEGEVIPSGGRGPRPKRYRLKELFSNPKNPVGLINSPSGLGKHPSEVNYSHDLTPIGGSFVRLFPGAPTGRAESPGMPTRAPADHNPQPPLKASEEPEVIGDLSMLEGKSWDEETL